MTDWTIILRSMRARLFSTATTVATVAVAVALMLVLLTMRDAARRAFDKGGGNMHLLLSRDASPLVSILNGLYYVNSPRAPIQFREYEQFATNPLVEWAIPMQLGDSYRARYPVVATAPEFFTKFKPEPDAEWSFESGYPFAVDFEVVIGAEVARETGLKAGQWITLTHGFPARDGGGAGAAHEHDQFKYTVVGVLNPTGQAYDRAVFTNLMSTWIIHAHDRIEKAHAGEDEHDHDHAHHDHDHEVVTTAADVTDEDKKITNVFVRVKGREGSDSSAVLPMVFDRLRRGQLFPGGVTVAQPKQELDKVWSIVGNVDRIIIAIAAAVLLSSGIAIMLALYNSMEQRRRQIAVLRVLGASRGRVLGLVLTESAVIGLLGAAAGVVLAAVGALVAATIMKREVGLTIDPTLQPVALILVAIGTIVLACLAGLVPALAAYNTSVMRNLRPIG
ncbi:MAG TPA: ABC transporter permease [Phycisphaerales bacterium]|nr:ABC transporter permease [Phycisphaerales bacterium]